MLDIASGCISFFASDSNKNYIKLIRPADISPMFYDYLFRKARFLLNTIGWRDSRDLSTRFHVNFMIWTNFMLDTHAAARGRAETR